MNENWTETFPQKEGSYYFYGYDYGASTISDREPEMSYVHVHRVRNGFAYVADGQFIYPGEAVGLWLEVEEPVEPRYQFLHMMRSKRR